MEWPEFVEPGYPVYRAFIVPRVVGEKPVYARKLTGEDVANWGATLDKLKTFLTSVNNFASHSGQRLEQRLELLADCITLFFKIPLMREVLPTVAPSPLKLYLMTRLLWPGLEKSFQEKPLKFVSDCYGEPLTKFSQSRVSAVFNDAELNKLVEEAWFNIPADTRPGANTSSLISHMLLTSSMAWAFAVQSGKSREEAAKIRISAIMHDIGKPFNYRKHYETSPKVAERLLSDIISEDELKDVVDAVKRHHLESAEIKNADRMSSDIDRLNRYVAATIMDDITAICSQLKLNPKLAYGSGEDAWNFWSQVEQARHGTVESLSTKFVRQVQNGNLPRPSDNILDDDLVMFLFDIGGIQDFILRSSELRSVSASSVLIDVATSAHIPLTIQKIVEDRANVWIPLESFLYTSGGVITMILPRNLGHVMDEVLNELRENYRAQRIRIYMASTVLRTDYHKTVGELGSRMVIAKLQDDHRYEPVRLDAGKLCDLCRMENGEKALETGEKVCETCYALYEFGDNLHFKQKWNSSISLRSDSFTAREVFDGVEWSDVSAGIMELLSGHSLSDLEALGIISNRGVSTGSKPRLRNVGLVKLDGNLMGEFFARSLSVTDALERSARVDMALKKALQEAVSKVVDAVEEPLEKRRFAALTNLGLMYVGGDDALLFCPSWAALPLAHHIGLAFHREMGEQASLSIGVVAAPPKHDVWAMIDAVSRLLQEAKRRGRTSKAGAICFDVVEAGVISGSSVKERHESLKERGLTAQPLPLAAEAGNHSLDDLIHLLCSYLDSSGSVDVFTAAYKASKDKPNEVADRLRKVRTAIKKTVHVGDSLSQAGDWHPYGVLFAFKMKDADEYLLIQKLAAKTSGTELNKIAGVPLADVDLMVKLLGGGVI
ncbi:MAG: HD domain-containing protein [Candidatus Caldarchaeum sp.]|nr:HD domain-containing protein [Candidatus Caldarchaeum sp.]